jgi:hypothetical protein
MSDFALEPYLKDLIEALTIFLKYGDPYSPTHCEHDALYVMIDPEDVSPKDTLRLEELGFYPDSEHGFGFRSYRFRNSPHAQYLHSTCSLFGIQSKWR